MSNPDSANRPAWWTRREIGEFTLGDKDANDIVQSATHTVVSWVTRAAEPVQAVMLYVVVDGLITVTSTTNRAKYHSWRRNPAASFCMWDPDNIGRQVTLRGRVEITQDDELLRRYTEGFLTRFRDGRPPEPEHLAAELDKFASPDRHMMQLQVDKVLSHDLPALLAAEKARRSR